jgi:hypothetical protein
VVKQFVQESKNKQRKTKPHKSRLIINKINKVQWVDFKLENVLVSLHFLKTMAPLFLRNGELLGHSPMHICVDDHQCSIVTSRWILKHYIGLISEHN